jgi:4-hydroxy-tetrahydrodipicolinate reductase
MLDLCLVGGLGRMGRAIAARVMSEADVRIVSVWEAPGVVGGTPDYGAATGYVKNKIELTSDGDAAVGCAQVVIDFASNTVFDEVVEACRRDAKPLVTGTTAVKDKETRLMRLSEAVAVVSAPNMATGVNVVFGLCRAAAEILGETSDIEIVEAHHRTKKDVPSGTALEIGRILGDATGKPIGVGRRSDSGLRSDEITIHSLRVGDVAGKHTVVFTPPGEVLEITHTAQSRACFAAGALLAARFASQSPPGLYSMLDVLGLSRQGG